MSVGEEGKLEKHEKTETNVQKDTAKERKRAKHFNNDFVEVVLSSTGGASKNCGGRMGQYCYDQDIDCYVQKNTEKSEEMYVPRYLFSSPDDVWGASDNPGDKSGWLYNSTPSKTLPLSAHWASSICWIFFVTSIPTMPIIPYYL